MKLRQSVIDARKIFAKSVDYDIEACVKEWRISRHSTKYFIREYCFVKDEARPEFENQWLLDLQVLTQAEYMAKYKLSRNAYAIRLCRARKEHGEIATPKQRARWEKEYWRAM